MTNEQFPCQYCDKIYTSKKFLDNHLAKCSNAKSAKINQLLREVEDLKCGCGPSSSHVVDNSSSSSSHVVDNSSSHVVDNSSSHVVDNSSHVVDNSSHVVDNSSSSSSHIVDNSSHIDNSRVVVVDNSRITINNFGSEDRSYVTDDTMKECFHHAHVIPLIMDVYFNPSHPENGTIKLKSEKLSRVIVHVDGRWIECDMNSSIDKMMQLEHDILTRFYWSPGFHGDANIDDDTKMKALENLGKLYKTHIKYFEQRRNIHAILKNAKASS